MLSVLQQNFGKISELFQDFRPEARVCLAEPVRRKQEPMAEAKSPSPTITTAPLSPHWAFVVQLRQGTPLTAEEMYGRVEHLASGQATRFASWEEVRAFMERVLAEIAERPT